MNKHTPGPWKIGGFAGSAARIDQCDGMVGIATASFMLDLAESDANARLIAAAPELLEAARNVVDVWRHCTTITKEEADSMFDLLAAVLKAEGTD